MVGVNDALNAVANIGLPSVNSSLGAMATPLGADGSVQLASGGAGGGGTTQFFYNPFITTGDQYEAQRTLRPFVEQVIREQTRK